MTEKQKLKYCIGCRDNFYNGNNPIGVKKCWLLDKMKVIWRKIVPLDQIPPWTQKPRRLPDCYQPERAICVGPKQTC